MVSDCLDLFMLALFIKEAKYWDLKEFSKQIRELIGNNGDVADILETTLGSINWPKLVQITVDKYLQMNSVDKLRYGSDSMFSGIFCDRYDKNKENAFLYII